MITKKICSLKKQFCPTWVLTTGLRCLIYDFHMSGSQDFSCISLRWDNGVWGSLTPYCVEIDAREGSRYTARNMRWHSYQVFAM